MDTKNNIETRKKVDRLVEEGKIDEVTAILRNVTDCQPSIPVDEFMRNVREDSNMKSKFSKRILIVAAICAVTSVSVGAATLLKQFTFNENGKFVTVTANNDISEEEAARLAKEVANDNVVPNAENTIEPESFKTIEEAEKAYDMKIALPDVKPALSLESVEGSISYISENSSTATIWATYGNIDEKAYGLTVTKKDFNDEDITDILSTDAEVTGDKFVSDKGYEFDVLNEIDEESDRSAKIFMTYVGNYEYCIYFTNFDDTEIENVVNSIDLGEYK